MGEEVDGICGAPYGERSDDRTNRRKRLCSAHRRGSSSQSGKLLPSRSFGMARSIVRVRVSQALLPDPEEGVLCDLLGLMAIPGNQPQRAKELRAGFSSKNASKPTGTSTPASSQVGGPARTRSYPHERANRQNCPRKNRIVGPVA
jgi:hypothetical protein